MARPNLLLNSSSRGDPRAAGAGGHGHLRASHADREQVIGTLKSAFVQACWTGDEFGQRLGQASAARAHAELAAVTADLSAGPAAASPPKPAESGQAAQVTLIIGPGLHPREG